MFDREYLKREMEGLDGLLNDRVNIYIIGGGAMSFQNLKDATKDIDVIVGSGIEMEQLGDALARIGYFIPAIRGPYKKMQANLIMENQDGFRWDIFVNVVCGGVKSFRLNEGTCLNSIFYGQALCSYVISGGYSIVIPYFEQFHDMGYSDMLSQMILDRLKKGNATEEEIGHEFGMDDIERHMEYLIKKNLVVRNSDGSYSLNLI